MEHRKPDAYRIQLDGLRAFAIGAVFIEHWTPWGSAVRVALPWGSLGVRLFFVLSGFLITDILLSNRARAEMLGVSCLGVLRRFMMRRVLRIFPALYLVAITMAVFDIGASRDVLPYTLSYTANLYFAALGTWPPAVAHFWTLGVEEQFYLFWPWLILFVPTRLLGFVVGVLLMMGPLSRLVVVLLGGNQTTAMCLPTSCLDTLGAGALLALAGRGLVPQWLSHAVRSSVTASLGIVLVLLLWGLRGGEKTASHQAMVVLLDCGLALAFVPLVARASTGLTGLFGRLLGFGPLVYLGRISYGLYLFHLIPGFLSFPLAPTDAGALARFAAYLMVSVAAASVSWHLFERPINGLKRYFPYVSLASASSSGAETGNRR